MSQLILEARERALRKALNDSDLRILLWDLIETDCHTFQSEYGHNATAYSLLAKQEIGKALLAELKYVDLERTFSAEAEYRKLVEQSLIEGVKENG